MTEPLVSIVIAIHNGIDYIASCLDSVKSQAYSNYEVIVVDNASTDGLTEFLEVDYPWVKVVRSQINHGYGGGNNLGVKHASGEFVLFLNHDTHVSRSFMTELVSALIDDPRIGLAQSRIMMAGEPDLVDSFGAYLTMTGIWYHPYHGEPYRAVDEAPVDILGACGTCMIVRRSLFNLLSGFDPDFFIYFDDADFAWRVRLHGERVVVVPRSVIYHWGGGTTLRLPSVVTVFHSFKNRLCSLLKLLNPADLFVVIPIHVCFCVGAAGVYLLRGKLKNSYSIGQALLWNLSNIRATRLKRREARSSPYRTTPTGYRGMIRSMPLGYLIKTSAGYFARW